MEPVQQIAETAAGSGVGELAAVAAAIFTLLKAWDKIGPVIIGLVPGLKGAPPTDVECLERMEALEANVNKILEGQANMAEQQGRISERTKQVLVDHVKLDDFCTSAKAELSAIKSDTGKIDQISNGVSQLIGRGD